MRQARRENNKPVPTGEGLAMLVDARMYDTNTRVKDPEELTFLDYGYYRAVITRFQLPVICNREPVAAPPSREHTLHFRLTIKNTGI